MPRRSFRLQNAASGGYATATGLDDKMDDSNALIEADAAGAGAWHFVFTTKDPAHDPHDEQFAIATAGAGARMATLDHYAQRHVLASADRFWPSDRQHMWKPIPRAGGAFSFRNAATRRLLCQSRVGGVVDTAPQSACDNPSCMWRLVDVDTGEVCRVLYDATVNVVPPEIAGSAREEEVAPAPAPSMVLRTQDAPAEMAERFVESLRPEHDLIRGMLESGYTSLWLGPQMVMGYRDGRISETYFDDEDSTFGMPQFKGKDSFEACPS